MALILKKASAEQKGVLIITHREYLYWTENRFYLGEFLEPYKLAKRLINKYGIRFFINDTISLIKSNYLIGVHWGFKHTDVLSKDWVDFHMSSKSTVNFLNEVNHIHLCSADFINEYFYPSNNCFKLWDIICVSRNKKFKNLDKFLISIRKIFDNNTKVKVCLIIPSIKGETRDKSCYQELVKDYNSMFSYEEKQRFVMLKSDPDMGNLGFSHSFIADMYRISKVFTLFSSEEGESRVIKEAIRCGLKVVVWKDLSGGGRDTLNSSNSFEFNDYDNAHTHLMQAVESFDCKEQMRLKRDDNGVALNILIEELAKVYAERELKFDFTLDVTDNLDRRLPNHYPNERPFWTEDNLSKNKWHDVDSISRIIKFKKYFKNELLGSK